MGSEKKPSTVAPANVEVQVALEESAKDAKSASCASKIIEEEAQPKGHLVVFVCSDEFEIACGCAICYSVFVICLQTDAVDAPFFIQFSERLSNPAGHLYSLVSWSCGGVDHAATEH